MRNGAALSHVFAELLATMSDYVLTGMKISGVRSMYMSLLVGLILIAASRYMTIHLTMRKIGQRK